MGVARILERFTGVLSIIGGLRDIVKIPERFTGVLSIIEGLGGIISTIEELEFVILTNGRTISLLLVVLLSVLLSF
jgi:hypothetical protein